ncbi:hypothetical protein PSHT_14570 [Puccinia striiformis]|uniref:Uncharacterized protein n=1 Tax=Puccinia striiformis TaxID=27350 RepID=A0A2S4UJR2_9BASI|nr:hypothetical protein PSHT_14570 [Puccinia striiformis]
MSAQCNNHAGSYLMERTLLRTVRAFIFGEQCLSLKHSRSTDKRDLQPRLREFRLLQTIHLTLLSRRAEKTKKLSDTKQSVASTKQKLESDGKCKELNLDEESLV